MNTNVALSAASSAKSAHAALTAQKQLAGTGTTNTVNERARQASAGDFIVIARQSGIRFSPPNRKQQRGKDRKLWLV